MHRAVETEQEAMFDDRASMPSLCRGAGVILGFEAERERKERERHDSESEEYRRTS